MEDLFAFMDAHPILLDAPSIPKSERLAQIEEEEKQKPEPLGFN